METIIENIKMAKKGNNQAKKVLRQHYLYLIDHYYEKYKEYIDKKEVEKMYDEFIDKYCCTENNIHLVLYLHKFLDLTLHRKFKAKEINVNETIIKACQGDENSRNQLIKYYSKIVIEKAKQYDYMEYDDLVQYGIIKLIEYIDILIEEHQNGIFLSNGIPRAIDIYFNKTLRKKSERWNMPLGYENDDLENKRVEIEFNAVVDSITSDSKRRFILKKYFLERETYDLIGMSIDESRESVRKIIKTYQPVLKKTYSNNR